jgi:hypothetical protein
MRASALALAVAASVSPASALSIDWARALSAIPAHLRDNSTATPTSKTTAITYCAKAGAKATNFVATITPASFASGDKLETTFDYVRFICHCWARRARALVKARGGGARPSSWGPERPAPDSLPCGPMLAQEEEGGSHPAWAGRSPPLFSTERARRCNLSHLPPSLSFLCAAGPVL